MLVLLLACVSPTGNGPIAWAVNYATVTPTDQGLSGVHMWVFYGEGWGDDRDPDWHVCSLMQQLEATPSDTALEGCVSCAQTYRVTLTEQEHDCDPFEVEDPGLTALPWMAIGSMPTELASDDPYPGKALGWYLGFDGETAVPHGYAYAEDLDHGRALQQPGWAAGQVYSLWPAYAWDMR